MQNGVSIGNAEFAPWTTVGDIPLELSKEIMPGNRLESKAAMIDVVANTAHYVDNDLFTVLELLVEIRRFYTTDQLPEGHSEITTPPLEKASVASDERKSQTTNVEAAKIPENPEAEVAKVQMPVTNASRIPEVGDVELADNKEIKQAPGPIEELSTAVLEKCPVYLPVRTASNTSKESIQTRIEALWRTLVMDCYNWQHPGPLECGFAFAKSIIQSTGNSRFSNCTTLTIDSEEYQIGGLGDYKRRRAGPLCRAF
jgi:hypothetical protein